MFGSLLGDGFDDMFGQMQRMNNVMNSFLNPFGNDTFGGGNRRSQSTSLLPFDDSSLMSPFGFPNMNQLMMRSMNQMNDPHCHSFSSSSVMTMTTGPDGAPQVYQASSSTRQGPGGIRETKKTVCDSRTGVKKMAIGHHIGERGHVKEKEQNMYSGQVEENDEYINLDEEEEPEFNKEWQTRAQQFRPRSANQAIGYHQSPNYGNYNQEYLALPPSSSAEKNKDGSQQKKKNHRSKPYDKRKEKKNKE